MLFCDGDWSVVTSRWHSVVGTDGSTEKVTEITAFSRGVRGFSTLFHVEEVRIFGELIIFFG